MPVSVNALTTWERAKAVLGFSYDQQEEVEFLIDAVSSTANRISGRKLRARDYDDLRVDGSGSNTLLLPEYPIVSVTALYVDRTRLFGDDTLLDPSSFQILSEFGMVRRYTGIFPLGVGVIKLTAKLGYFPVPEDLELAVLEGVSYNRRRLGSDTIGMRQISVDGQVTSQYEIGLPLTVREVFESYRRER
jgi:hypothetical protein